jgi:hypothetical protein
MSNEPDRLTTVQLDREAIRRLAGAVESSFRVRRFFLRAMVIVGGAAVLVALWATKHTVDQRDLIESEVRDSAEHAAAALGVSLEGLERRIQELERRAHDREVPEPISFDEPLRPLTSQVREVNDTVQRMDAKLVRVTQRVESLDGQLERVEGSLGDVRTSVSTERGARERVVGVLDTRLHETATTLGGGLAEVSTRNQRVEREVGEVVFRSVTLRAGHKRLLTPLGLVMLAEPHDTGSTVRLTVSTPAGTPTWTADVVLPSADAAPLDFHHAGQRHRVSVTQVKRRPLWYDTVDVVVRTAPVQQ